MKWFWCFAVVVWAGSGLSALDLDLTRSDIEAALKIARGSAAERAGFHGPYVLSFDEGVLERVEVVTELRRVVQIAEERIAGGDHLFAHGTIHAEAALRPWRRRVAVVARLRFHPQNAYVMAPPVHVELRDAAGELPRLDMRSESLLALASGAPDERLPVVGAVAEALFDAIVIGQRSCTAVIRLGENHVAAVPIDFAKLP